MGMHPCRSLNLLVLCMYDNRISGDSVCSSPFLLRQHGSHLDFSISNLAYIFRCLFLLSVVHC